MMRRNTAIVLMNLGSPESATIKSIRKYLAEFLSDRHVVKINPLLWKCLLHGFILPFYAKRSTEKYQKIWSKEGSPLIATTSRLAEKLEHQLQTDYPSEKISVRVAMRYGSPNLESVFAELKQQSVSRLVIFPLYPQYAESTTGSAIALVNHLNTKYAFEELQIIDSYYKNSHYIDAICQSITNHISDNGKPEQLIFSFHGLPQRNALPTIDPYLEHCKSTVNAVCERLNLSSSQVALTFQSRFGPSKWLQPYTQEYLESLPKRGIKNVAVICPGFAVDCLETLEEINITNRDKFMLSKGQRFDYIAALNDSELQTHTLIKILSASLRAY